jgi:hypothetical protein
VGTRAQIVAAVRDKLPTNWDVRDHPLPLSGPPDASVPAVIVVERAQVSPAPNVQGSYLEEHHIWVIEPTQDATAVEDNLDEHLDFLLETIAPLTWLSFTRATRSVFAEQFHAYDVTVEVVSTTDTQE